MSTPRPTSRLSSPKSGRDILLKVLLQEDPPTARIPRMTKPSSPAPRKKSTKAPINGSPQLALPLPPISSLATTNLSPTLSAAPLDSFTLQSSAPAEPLVSDPIPLPQSFSPCTDADTNPAAPAALPAALEVSLLNLPLRSTADIVSESPASQPTCTPPAVSDHTLGHRLFSPSPGTPLLSPSPGTPILSPSPGTPGEGRGEGRTPTPLKSQQPSPAHLAPPLDTPAAGAPATGGVRLLAIDLDGTLLDDNKRISLQTADALRCLRDDIRIIIASARPPRSVRGIYSLLHLDTLTINYNGALVWDEPNRKLFHHTPMPGPLVQRIIEQARSRFPEVLVSCESLDRWYTDRFDNHYTTETGRMFKPDVIAPLDTFHHHPMTKLLLLGAPEMITLLTTFLQKYLLGDAIVVRCDPQLIQIMHPAAGKGPALRRVAHHYGIAMNQVLAIGDAANDVDMLQAAGIAVAMDNAHPRVKAVSHWIAPSNNDHGVHAALQRFGLCA